MQCGLRKLYKVWREKNLEISQKWSFLNLRRPTSVIIHCYRSRCICISPVPCPRLCRLGLCPTGCLFHLGLSGCWKRGANARLYGRIPLKLIKLWYVPDETAWLENFLLGLALWPHNWYKSTNTDSWRAGRLARGCARPCLVDHGTVHVRCAP
jgi:hypothetical protein